MNQPTLQIIALSGKRGAGKTSAADYLALKYGYRVVSFASSLRDMAKLFFPFTDVDFGGTKKERPYREYDWTPRDFLISLGALGRYYDNDYWVKKAHLESMKGKIVVDDLRFPNEVEYLKQLGAKIVRINRYERLNIYGKNLDDPSETALDKYGNFDYTIEDCINITKNDLYNVLDKMMKDKEFKGERNS